MVSENNFVLTRACSDVKQKHDIVQRKNQLKIVCTCIHYKFDLAIIISIFIMMTDLKKNVMMIEKFESSSSHCLMVHYRINNFDFILGIEYTKTLLVVTRVKSRKTIPSLIIR